MIDLPPRVGARPKTTSTNPHQQQSQNPTPEIYELLLSKAFDFPHVERRPSAISVPGAQALWLAEAVAGARPEAFLIGREFAHLHPPYDGSMHMMLPQGAVEELLEKGWGEPHPMARRGLIPPTAVMVYAPRDAAEVETILQVLAASYRFACGEGPAA
ncbi:MAG: luciferase family protein [Geminicoccaceae bacterium]